MTYVGGKNGAGVFQRIINQVPPHSVLIEPFMGSGAILRRIRPCSIAIGIDKADRAPYLKGLRHAKFVQGCGIEFLERYDWRGGEFVFADPPYLKATRSTMRDLYDFELTDADHERLLRVLVKLPALVMLCGYPSDLYNQALPGWRRIYHQVMTRGGLADECLWLNYPAPVSLHDYRHLGADYRERERIKRKAARWVANLKAMPALEQQAVFSAMRAQESATVAAGGEIPSPRAAVRDSKT